MRIEIDKSIINAKHGDRNETFLSVALNLFFAISFVVDRSFGPVVFDAVLNFFGNRLLLSPPQKSCKLMVKLTAYRC